MSSSALTPPKPGVRSRAPTGCSRRPSKRRGRGRRIHRAAEPGGVAAQRLDFGRELEERGRIERSGNAVAIVTGKGDLRVVDCLALRGMCNHKKQHCCSCNEKSHGTVHLWSPFW